MVQSEQHHSEPSPIGWTAALILLFLPGVLQAILVGPHHAWGLALFAGTLLAVPFAYLGIKGTTAPRTWLVTISLTVCFWVLPQAVVAIRPESHEWVIDITMGLVMLAGPFIVIAGARSAMQSKSGP